MPHRLALRAATAFALVAVAAGCGASEPQAGNKELVVWADAKRTEMVKAYQAAHPETDLRVVTIPGTASYVPGKVSLSNRTKDGWPDVVFLPRPAEITQLVQLEWAQPLEDLVEPDVRNGFAPGALDICTVDGEAYCLRNDIAQTVLWYDAGLMNQFGYKVPGTWAEYQELGKRLAREHPGYLIGNFGDPNGSGTFLQASGCPVKRPVGADQVHINTADPKCKRVTELLDPLVANGTVAMDGSFDPAFVEVAKQRKILMLPAPSWMGDFAFKTTYGIPVGQLAAAPMPTWDGEKEHWSGSGGGGLWAISTHTGDKQKAADLVTWLTTGDVQGKQPTYPAFAKAADAWCAGKAKDSFYAKDPCPVFREQASMMRSGYGPVRFEAQFDAAFSATLVSAGRAKKSMTEALPGFGTQLVSAAETAGYVANTEG